MQPTFLPDPASGIVFSAGHYAAKAAQHPFRAFYQLVLKPHFWVFAALATTVAGMQLAFLVSPLHGVYATVMALAACMLIAVRSRAARLVAVATAVIPAATLLALCVSGSSSFVRACVLYGALLALGITYRLQFAGTPAFQGRGPVRAGAFARLLPGMVVLGQALGALAYVALQHQYAYGGIAVGTVVGAAVLFAITEEIFFRGLLQPSAATVLHPGMAAVLSAVLYAAVHLGAGNWVAVAVAAVTGAVLAAVYYKTRSVALTVALNITAKLVFMGLLTTLAWGYF